MRPLACVATGVTICFGGILRDLIVRRDVRLGSQAYAAATAAGTLVYVGLREAALLGLPLSLGTRAVLSAGSTVTVRVIDYRREEPLLPPMHGRAPRPRARDGRDAAAEGPSSLG